jgi:hypothetical protein
MERCRTLHQHKEAEPSIKRNAFKEAAPKNKRREAFKEAAPKL